MGRRRLTLRDPGPLHHGAGPRLVTIRSQPHNPTTTTGTMPSTTHRGATAMHTTRTTAATLAVAALLFTGCTSSSDDKPEPTKTETVTAAPEPETAPLTEEETIEQCTDAVAEAATGWDNWTMPLEDWEDDPDTPDVCKSLEAIDYRVAFLAGLEDAAACGTPDEMPGRC